LNNISNSPIQRNTAIEKRLEKAVFEHFSENAFHTVNIRAIAKQAGMSLGTLYKYYGSKEELLFYFVDKRLSGLTNRLIDHLQGIEDIKERLRKVFWVGLDFYERNSELGKIVFITIPEKTWMLDKTYRQKKLTDIWIGVLREGQENGYLNPNIRAGLVLDLFWGLIMRSFRMWVYREKKEGLASQSNILFDIIWNGISNREN
jgi:AcrR family transcriptional regulator